MTLRRGLIIPLALASLALGAGFFSSTAFAQTQPSQADLEKVKQTVITEVGKVPADTTQPCDGSEDTVLHSSCVTKATKSGSTKMGIPYSVNDLVKCKFEITTSFADEYCTVAHADGSVDYYDAGNNHTDNVKTDASGKIIAGTINGVSNTALGVAAACIGGTGTDCTQAVANTVAPALADVGSEILRAVASTILSFANFLLGISGAALNYVVYYAVFNFGSLIGNSPGVLLAWGILRDIANMLLLFGFIFLGVATILDADKFATKKAIPQLLIFAILMNFSLFACEAVIDVANGTSSLLYSQADPMSTQCNGTFGSSLGDKCSFLNYGIAGHIMQSTGLSTFWQNATGDANPVALLALAIFATIGTIVCFAAAIMLAIRLVVLTFLMIASPIGFAGMAIPFFQKFSNDWWHRVIHQSFFAPIMFLLIFISLKLADSFSSATSQSAGLGAVATSPNALDMGVILVFMLVCGFLIASIIVAHRFGAMGAQGAIGYSKKFVLGGYGYAGRLGRAGVRTTSGVAGRNTVGKFSNYAQKKYNGYVATGGLKFLQGSALDDAIGNTLKKGTEAKFGSNKSFKSDKEHHEARDKELRKIERLGEVGRAKNTDDMKKALSKLSDAEIAESEAFKKGGEQLKLIAQSLSPEKFEKLMNNDKINDARKDEARNARFEVLSSAIGTLKNDPNDKDAQEKISSLTSKDIGQLGQSTEYSTLLSDATFAGALSDDQYKDGRKNTNLTAAQVSQFDTARNAAISSPEYMAGKIAKMNAEDINKLKSDILSNTKILKEVSGRKLALIDPDKIGDDKHLDAVVSYIKKNALQDPAKAAEFRAQYNADPRIKARWQKYGIK